MRQTIEWEGKWMNDHKRSWIRAIGQLHMTWGEPCLLTFCDGLNKPWLTTDPRSIERSRCKQNMLATQIVTDKTEKSTDPWNFCIGISGPGKMIPGIEGAIFTYFLCIKSKLTLLNRVQFSYDSGSSAGFFSCFRLSARPGSPREEALESTFLPTYDQDQPLHPFEFSRSTPRNIWYLSRLIEFREIQLTIPISQGNFNP